MKNILAHLVFTLTLGAFQIFAASLTDLSWTVTDNTVTITDCKTTATGRLDIPETIEGLPVTAIGEGAFASCLRLTKITIPDNISTIGNHAFFRCYTLTEIVIPDGVTSIGDFAFAHCYDITSLSLGNSLSSIGDSAFYACIDLTDLSLGNTLSTIGDSAFSDCSSLTRLAIPDSVSSIGVRVFYNCSSLITVMIGNGLSSVPSWTFSRCPSLTSVSIGTSVTSFTSGSHYESPTLSSILMDGPPPPEESFFDFSELPANASIKVWPEYAEAFGGVGSLWKGLPVQLRDTTPKIASLSVDGVTTVTLTGGPNTTYRCLYSPNLQTSFTQVTTIPEVIATDSSATTSFTVDTPGEKGFFVLEEVLP